jgi:TolB-like protein/DNA-binding winged helix-turn-helix (wHTH) protein
MDVPINDRGAFLFGRFRLDPVRRALLRDGVRVNLTTRMFDALLYLVEHADRVVEADELVEVARRGGVADTFSLDETIFALRRVLDADEASEILAITVAGRGYRFGVPVRFEAAPADELRFDLFERSGALLAGPLAAPPPTPWWRRWQFGFGAVVILVAAAGFAYWGTLPTLIPFTPPAHSIAVLAFTTMSGNPGDASFAQGMSQELAGSLGRVRGLSVAAPSVSFAFQSGNTKVGDVARRLHVGAVLEGSVRRYGPRVRIIARLSNGLTGDPYWSRSYDQDQGDLSKMEQAIADEVITSLQVAN